MSPPSRVVVMGATLEEPPPGIGVIADSVELVFADTEESMGDGLVGSDVILAWRPRSGLLQPVWHRAGAVKWIQSASAGVDRLLFPELVDSHVVVTNARGVFDQAIAEYVLTLVLAFAKGMPGVLDRQGRGEWKPRDTEGLADKRVLVVGMGPIGRAIGVACQGLGMTVRGVATTSRRRDDVFRVVYGADELLDALS